MKVFKILNKKTGARFSIEREALGIHQPEWGRHERWLTEQHAKLEGLDLKDAIETREDEQMGETVTLYKFPAEYTIEEEDLTQEIAEREAKHEAREALRAEARTLKAKHKDLDFTKIKTSDVPAILLDMHKRILALEGEE